MRHFALFSVCCLFAGCGSYSDVERPALSLGVAYEEDSPEPGFRGPGVGIEKTRSGVKVSEEDIRVAMEAAGPFSGPMRVAVVEIRRNGTGPVSVSPEDMKVFRAALGDSVDAVMTVPQMFLPEAAELPALRYAAARVGANTVFLFNRAQNSGTYFNNWSNLNWFILPIFVVPGKTAEIYAAAEGALIDVATSRVRAVAAADVRLDADITTVSSSSRPIEEMTREGSLKSLETLGEDLGKQISSIRVGSK